MIFGSEIALHKDAMIPSCLIICLRCNEAELILLGCNKAELIFLGCQKFLGLGPAGRPICVLYVCVDYPNLFVPGQMI